MTESLTDLLDRRGWILADGCLRTALAARGVGRAEPLALCTATHPEELRAAHAAFVAAGTELILTNSHDANAARLRLAGAEARMAELNHAAAAIARSVAGPALVGGRIGPTGEVYGPLGPEARARLVAQFEGQVAALRAGGADLIWAEGFAALPEFEALSEAVGRAGMDWCGTICFDSSGRSLLGLTPAALAARIEHLPHPPLAYGASGGPGPSDLIASVLGFAAAGCERPRIARGNSAVPRNPRDPASCAGTPETMATFARLALDAGARLIGGACGTLPAHIAAMRAALEHHAPGPRPLPEQIAARLGPFSAEED